MDMLDRMRKLASEKGITNNLQFSKYTGVPYTTIDNFYKVGYENAKLSTLKKIATALECSLEYLVNGNSEEELEEEIQAFARRYANLNDIGKQLINDALASVERAGLTSPAQLPEEE